MNIMISSVEGNRQKLDGGAMFGNAPRPMWEKWMKPDERGRIELACRAMLIECDEKKILCETGIGAFFEPKLAERYGVQDSSVHRLKESLQKLGIQEKDIDAVILSHLHFDHAGGLLPSYEEIQAGRQELLFPRAKYVVGAEAWERALHPHVRDRASFIADLPEKLKKSGRLVIVPKGENSVPQALPKEIELSYSSGHTPGHMHTLVKGEQSNFFFCGDLIPGSSWVHAPITMGYDRFPEQLIDEKQKVYDRAIPENWFLFFTHDPVIAASRCRLDEQKKSVVFDEQKTLVRKKI